MIVMDLEWNRSYDKKRLEEILQIGAVRVAAAGGAILSTFNAFVKPRVHKRFDPGARKLPDLQSSVEHGVTFAEAWAAFTDWCGGERVFAFWGPDDFGVIRRNCAYWGVPAFEPEKVYDFQRAFAHAYGAQAPVMALWRVVDYLGIPEIFEFHNALYDAMYTALVGAWLRQEDLDFTPPARAKRRRRRGAKQTVGKAEPSAAAPKKRARRRPRRRKKPKPDAAEQTETTR